MHEWVPTIAVTTTTTLWRLYCSAGPGVQKVSTKRRLSHSLSRASPLAGVCQAICKEGLDRTRKFFARDPLFFVCLFLRISRERERERERLITESERKHLSLRSTHTHTSRCGLIETGSGGKKERETSTCGIAFRTLRRQVLIIIDRGRTLY